MRTILIVGTFPPPYNGTTIANESILRSDLINRHFEIITLRINRDKTPKESEIGKFSFWKLFSDLYALVRFFQLIPKTDIIYLTISQTQLGLLRDSIFLFIGKLTNKQAIIHLHGGSLGSIYNKKIIPLFQKWIEFVLKRVNFAITLSPSLREIFLKYLPSHRVKYIYNFVNPEYFLTDDEIYNKILYLKRNNTINVLYLSNFLESKGYWDVLRVANIFRNHQIIRFYLAGKFPSILVKKNIMNYINSNKLTNVKVLDFVWGNDKRELLLKSHIFVLPSKYEGLPISLLEAMAMGLIPIVSRVGGIRDVISEGDNGFFVDPGNYERIGKIIKELMENKDLMFKIIRNNVNEARNMFTFKKFESSLFEIFHNVGLGKKEAL